MSSTPPSPPPPGRVRLEFAADSKHDVSHTQGRGARGQHTRSASHVGILRYIAAAVPPLAPVVAPESASERKEPLGPVSSLPPGTVPPSAFSKGHQRAMSQGQVSDHPHRGHRREGSRTEFILPEGHEKRERERELRATKPAIKRSSVRSSVQWKGHSREASRSESVYTIRDHKQSLLQRLCFWRKSAGLEAASRHITPNAILSLPVTHSSHPNFAFPNNKISTAKYTMLSFLPKNLFEQLHRFANLYFVFIVLLNFVPAVTAFSPELAVLPLAFVLGVTAVKDAYEDRRRHRTDAVVNDRLCAIYSSSSRTYAARAWMDVRAGDVVRVRCGETIPADMVVLRSSAPNGVCYVESANLDGETNLKQRQSVKGIPINGTPLDPGQFPYVLEVGPPTTKMQHFVGSVMLDSATRLSLTNDNLVLRECILRNTDFIEGIVVYAGRDTKALLNNGCARYKRSKLERHMNREVVICVFVLILASVISATGAALWQSYYAEESLEGLVPFLPPSVKSGSTAVERSPLWVAFTSFWTFIILYQVLIPISLYVTIEVIKMVQVYHIQKDDEFYDPDSKTTINCRAMNITEELGQVEHVFTDKTGTLTENKMLFRRCCVNGREYRHEIDAEDETQFVPNDALSEEVRALSLQKLYAPSVRPPSQEARVLADFLLTMAACNTVVVSKRSRPTTLEIPLLEVPFRPRSLSPIAPSPPSTPPPTPPTPPQTPQIEEECHVTFDRHLVAGSRLRPVKFQRPESLPRATPNVSCPLNEASTPPADLYEAESPDELALVRASFAYGCKLVSRDLASIRVLIPGSGICEFEVLHVLPFDSNRKRMSVIVRHSDTGQKVLYCKGADSSIFENLSELADSRTCPIVRATEERVHAFARSGLRVLLTARRLLSDAQFEQWSREHKVAAASVANREKKLSESYAKIEINLQLTGATGVEDRLQDGVPETLSALRCAGVRVWVLTGDKHETAVNVAYACNLFTSEMQILKLQCRSKEATERMLFTYRERLEATLKGEDKEDSQTALVVDGVTLVYILDRRTNLREKFMHVACLARAVLVVRANPLQKALIVRAAKQLMNTLTLAVGDGANDVSMIQAADVGVGIFGVEGRQAAMASDFAVSRFRHLAPLMLVHGHWAYHRLANTILYFFYKNACFVFLLLWYQLYCGFSTTVMIDDLFLVSFNLLFTSLPPLAFGIYDQDASRRVLSSQPRLYAHTRLGRVYAPAAFWLNLSDAFYQSIAIFFVAVGTYYGSDVDIFEFGTCITHACLITQLLHIAIETKSWTALTVGALLSSYFLFLAFGFVYTTWCAACLSSMPNRAGEFTHALGTSRHWLAILLSTVLALLPRLSVRSLQCTLWPDVVSAAVRRAAAAADLLERRASIISVDRNIS